MRQDQSIAIDELINRQMEGHQIPGIAVAVIRNGAVIKKVTTGFSNIASKIQVTDSTSFQIASTTKSFTATCVMLLVNEGILELSDRIGDILTGLPTAWQNVTVRQLLSHTSGIPDISTKAGGLELIATGWEPALKKIYNSPMLFYPGENWSYGVTSYVLLAKLIEQKVNKPFEQVMKERLFDPLEMKNTYFTGTVDSAGRIATNYELQNGEQVIRDLIFPEYVHAAGGLFSSLADLIQWNLALDVGAVVEDELRTEMWTAVSLNNGKQYRIDGKQLGYGLGWTVDDTPGQRAVGHSGGNSTAYKRFIDEEFTVIVLHNGMYNPEALVAAIAAIMRSDEGDAEPTPQVRLWDAAMTGDTTEITNAINQNADIELLDTRMSKSGRRALNWAAWFNHAEALRVLLRNGANINATNATGFTALHHAAESGSLSAARMLLENGANPDIKNSIGNDAAEVAKIQNHPEIASLIQSFVRK